MILETSIATDHLSDCPISRAHLSCSFNSLPARLFARPLERFVSPPFFGEKLSDLKRKGHSDF